MNGWMNEWIFCYEMDEKELSDIGLGERDKNEKTLMAAGNP